MTSLNAGADEEKQKIRQGHGARPSSVRTSLWQFPDNKKYRGKALKGGGGGKGVGEVREAWYGVNEKIVLLSCEENET